MGLPTFAGKCDGCLKCLAICPGLAITLVRENQDGCEITFAVEQNISFERNSRIMLCDRDGKNIGPATVIRVVKPGSFNKTQALTVSCAKEFAPIAASIALFKSPLDEMVQSPYKLEENKKELQHLLDQELEDPIICRCERIRKSTIDNLIAQGIRDLNQIKGITRAGMGACGGKTCQPLIVAAMRQAGIPLEEILKNTSRPLFTELTLGILAGEKDE